jgi:methylglutaconyl-CoA hydratase
MADRYLIQRREGGVEYLTLNRPDVRNAFDERMIAELSAWASAAKEDPALRCVVLAGAGPTFSAGADIAWMKRQAGYTEEENLRDAAAAARMFSALDTLPVPTIARIQGAALGGGAGLVAVCDVAVAEEEARFGFTEVKLGILPAVISPFVLGKIGRSAARELFLSGTRFSAARAREIGLVHAVVPPERLDEVVDGYVREVLSAGPEAIAAAKALIRDVCGRPIEEAAPLTASALARRRVSAEGQEGLAAFLERRTPSWSR